MKAYCGYCVFYNPISYMVWFGERNVSGGLAWYQRWLENSCELGKYNKENRCVFYESKPYIPKPDLRWCFPTPKSGSLFITTWNEIPYETYLGKNGFYINCFNYRWLVAIKLWLKALLKSKGG